MKFIPQILYDGEGANGAAPTIPIEGAPPIASPAAPRASILTPPTAPAAPPAAAPPVAPPTGAPPAAGDTWFSKLSAEEQAYAQNKGWTGETDPKAIMQSYQNLEKTFGADKAGRTVLLPKDAADKATADAMWTKLGKPTEAKDYEIELPQGADPVFAETAKTAMHKANLTGEQAKAITTWYRATELDAIKAVRDKYAMEVTGLEKDWGANYDGNVNTARAGWKAGGFTDEQTTRMENAIGPNAFAKGFEKIGQSFKEAQPPANGTRTATSTFGNLSPDSARLKQQQLRTDSAFMSRYNSPDPKVRAGAIEEMSSLAAIETGGR